MRPWLSSLILGLSIILTAAVLGSAWKKTHDPKETIKVTGLAEKNFTSDLIVWNGSIYRKAATIEEAYALIKRDADEVRQYMTSKGITDKEFVLSAVNVNQEFRQVYSGGKGPDYGGAYTSVPDGYGASQSFTIESNKIDNVEKISREVTELFSKGIQINSQAPYYYYTKLAELKIEMLAAAAKDAHIRAEKIAENAGAKLGNLKNAAMGVFQITAQNSNEEYSYGGAFNITSREKTASITARTEFGIE